MTVWKDTLKRWWCRLRRVEPEPVVVSFASGDPALVEGMVREVLALLPGYRHFLVTDQASPSIPEVNPILIVPGGPGVRALLRRYRIGMAPVLFDSSPHPLRRAAFWLAPRKILAYNSLLERHHLSLACPLASLLFLRGVPLDRIWLRPRWLFPWRRDRTIAPDSCRLLPGRPTSPLRARVAVLTPFFPYPLAHGGAVRLFSLLRHNSTQFDIFLFSFVENESPADFEPLRQFCAQLILVPKPRYREPRWSTLLPPEVGEYRSPAMRKALARYRREFEISLLQVEYTQLAAYRGDILVEHDITHDLYRQVYSRSRSLSAFWDWWRWRRFERGALRRSPRVVAMSAEDAALTGHPRVTVIPNGVDLARFQPVPEPPGCQLLFIGSFRHFPNIVAFRFLTGEVWPLLTRSLPEARLVVVAGPDPQLHWTGFTGLRELPEIPGVTLKGFVADVKPLYDTANLVVVPTLVSAGTNIKVLEAMAMERAVVSTTRGCAGLGLVHGQSVWIADNAPDFATAIARLAADAPLRRSLAVAAAAQARRDFSWEALARRQAALWAELHPSPLTIRPGDPGDLAALVRIQELAPESARWPAADYLRYRLDVADFKQEIIGFLASRPTAGEEYEILDLAVDPAWRRQGVATRLLAPMLESAAEIFLEVRESNAAARNLYRSVGFVEVARRPAYYRNPIETGIVMRRRK